jgi:hypothetical protein
METVKTWLTIWLALAGVAFAGCDARGLVPAEGKVTLDGQPLAGVHVIFFPVGASVNDPTMFSGLTDANGHYVLRGQGGGPEGIAPGSYRVSLTTAVAGPNDDETTPLPQERVPAKYRDGKLQFDVPEGGAKDANFDLKSR